MPDEPVSDLELRLERLETRVSEIYHAMGLDRSTERQASPARVLSAVPETDAVPTISSAPGSMRAFVPDPGPQPETASTQRDAPALGLEGLFGGRILLVVGALVLLIGIGFFIKYAFDNGWIGPTGRVAIGLLAGIAGIGIGERFQRSERSIFAQAMTGLGGAILYLSLWAAGNGFHLVPLSVSFAAMALVTAALAVLSARRNSEITASFALVGGFITPLLNVTDSPQPIQLLSYIGVLDSAFVFLPATRRWPRIQSAAFLFTQLYLFFTIGVNPTISLWAALAFATLFLLVFLAQPLRQAFLARGLDVYEQLLVAVATGAYYTALHVELFERHRHWLTVAVVVLAALFVAAARAARSQDRTIFAAIALALITGGVAITFTGSVVSTLWTVEGAVLAWIGLTRQQWVVRAFGFAALALGIATALVYPPADGHVFANERFATFAILAACLFAVRYSFSLARGEVTEVERYLYTAVEPLGHIAVLYAVSSELFHLTNHNELSQTLFWLAYAAALFAIGVYRRSPFTRWEGFALLTVAILKAFAVDMSEVNPAIRIVSFLALGSVILAISFASQRYAKKAQ